jgi:glutathione S-transferase
MADISFSYSLLLATSLGLQNDFPETLVPYWQGLQQREGFKRALRAEQGDPPPQKAARQAGRP